MDALKKSITGEAPAKGKKSRKASAGQKEMLMPIGGKKMAKETAAKKSSAKQHKAA
jgi:DNA end-binding protein Ku